MRMVELGRTLRVAVAGATGYAGGEVLRLLAAHPVLDVTTVTAHANAGDRLGDHQPHLASLADLVLQPTDAEHLAGHDVVFLGLPHGASGAITAALRAVGDRALILDCGADHRLEREADWDEFYGTPWAGCWPYGLPELVAEPHPAAHTPWHTLREKLGGVTEIAVPGCNVTAVSLAAAPALAAGLVDPHVTATLAVGTSGAGKKATTHLLASERLGSALPYGVGGTHRHIPEIVQNLSRAAGTAVGVVFTPVLVPMSRGILATVTAPLADGVDPEEAEARLRAVYAEAYAGERFVTVLPPGRWPATGSVAGSNSAQLGLAVDRRARTAVLLAAIDNLGKGTAGGAIQSANIALGLPEALGLPAEGVAP